MKSINTVIKLGEFNHQVEKIEVAIVDYTLNNNDDSKKVADVTVALDDMRVKFSVIEGSDRLYAINPFLTKLDNGAEFINVEWEPLGYFGSLELLRHLSTVAVDYHNIKSLKYRHEDYDKIGNRGCSNCRHKQIVEFDIKELNESRRLYCKIKEQLIDEKAQAVKKVLNSTDSSRWLLKEEGVLISNPEWGTEGSYKKTLENLLDGGELGCRYHHYAFKKADGGWYHQPVYNGHMMVNFKEQEFNLPNAIVRFELTEQESTLYSLYEELHNIGNFTEVADIIKLREVSKLGDICKGIVSNLDTSITAEELESAIMYSNTAETIEEVETKDAPSNKDKLIKLCVANDIPVEEDGRTSLDFLINEDEESVISAISSDVFSHISLSDKEKLMHLIIQIQENIERNKESIQK